MMIAAVNRESQILFWNYLSMALRGCGIFIPLTLAIFKPRMVSSQWAVASMVLPLGASIVAGMIRVDVSPIFVGLGTSLLVILLGIVARRRGRQQIVERQ